MPTRNATAPVSTTLPESSSIAPVAMRRIPETASAKAETRGRDMPGAKVGPISNPMAQPRRATTRMSAYPAWPKPCSTAVGRARMNAAPSTAKSAVGTHGRSMVAGGRATFAFAIGKAPVVADSAWRARSGVR